MAGGLFAFAKGSISPETIHVSRSIDGLVMVLLGGIQTLTRTDRRSFGIRHAAGYRHAAERNIGGHCSASSSCFLVMAFRSRKLLVHFLFMAPSRGEAMSVLAIRSLSKAFGGVRAVNDVTFEIEQGEFLAMIGPNGAGKSTCFNMINGQLKPDSGQILFEGSDIAGLEPRAIWRLGVGRTFQVAATFSSMTVIENVQMALISHAGETIRALARRSRIAPRPRTRSPVAGPGCARPPIVQAVSLPMATSSALNSP